MVSWGVLAGFLSNHFGIIISAVTPVATPMPSTSTTACTKACGASSTVTSPNRNGRAKRIGRSKVFI